MLVKQEVEWMKTLQTQHKVWVDKKFPRQPHCIPAAGMVEEAGELLHAVLCMERANIWGHEERYPAIRIHECLLDAIGDCTIYLCSFCNAADWRFSEMECHDPEPANRELLTVAIDLVRIAAEFSISHCRDFAKLYLITLKVISKMLGVDFKRTVTDVWTQVRVR